jgi:hypothetical protein
LNHREWLERRRGGFVRVLQPEPVSRGMDRLLSVE